MRTLGVINEEKNNETRVALVPDVVEGLIKNKLAKVVIEKGAGQKAGFPDGDYISAGARLFDSKEEVLESSDVILAINAIKASFKGDLANKIVIGLFDPFFHKEQIKELCRKNVTAIALELVPRISRAQSMDVLSSQSNIAGYVAVILVANKLNKIMPLMMTAAGTIKPAKVLVLGAGVAGLSAIATAKRLGAVVFAYDVRPVVKEQVETLGARFIDIKLKESGEGSGGYAKALSQEALKEQRHGLALVAKDMDVVITTAQIPGKKAPLLLDEQVFSLMKPGSVIVDLAASSGGNVFGSVVDEWQRRGQVLLYGADNLAKNMPKDASTTFAKNLRSFLELVFLQDNELNLNDEILKDAVICHQKVFISKVFKQSIE